MLTGTVVLALAHGPDTLQALGRAAELSVTALGLLVRYLTRPPAPGTARAEIAAQYGMSIGALRAAHGELATAGYLMQVRRPIGQGGWQHLICVVDEPGRLPAPHAAWALLEASLAADAAHISGPVADVVTSANTAPPQAVTSRAERRIEPVTPLSAADDQDRPCVVGSVAELRRLAQLPPLPAPKDAPLWLTPGQVLSLITHYPPRYGDLALGVLARCRLPFYLAAGVMALLIQGYTTEQLGRALAGVHDAEHPGAVARWRLDRMLMQPEPERVAWRPPSTTVERHSPPAPGVLKRGMAHVRAELARVKPPAPRREREFA